MTKWTREEQQRLIQAGVELQQKERRERIATAALQGLVTRGGYPAGVFYQAVTQDAVRMADALIAELDK